MWGTRMCKIVNDWHSNFVEIYRGFGEVLQKQIPHWTEFTYKCVLKCIKISSYKKTEKWGKTALEPLQNVSRMIMESKRNKKRMLAALLQRSARHVVYMQWITCCWFCNFGMTLVRPQAVSDSIPWADWLTDTLNSYPHCSVSITQ